MDYFTTKHRKQCRQGKGDRGRSTPAKIKKKKKTENRNKKRTKKQKIIYYLRICVHVVIQK